MVHEARDFAAQVPDGSSAELRVMAGAATQAAKGLMEAWQNRTELTVTQKSAGDFVSQADKAAEDIIADHLNTAFPGYGWLGEESAGRQAGPDGLRWIVDPLDGTTNFLRGLPHWAISIALYRGDAPLCGLIFDPVKSETFCAQRGGGAWLNGTRIQVAAPGKDFHSALLATGVPSGARSTYLDHALGDMQNLMPISAGIRRWGAAALDLAYVAAGRFDAYWERNLGAWDIAAGALIVEEAGGVVQPLWPDKPLLASGSFVAGHKEAVEGALLHLNRTEK